MLALSPADPRRLQSPDRFQLLQTFANQTALALERTLLAAERERARVDIETERARNALLSSVSHDLRTPLAAITGAASGLRDSMTLDGETRRELADTIVDEAQRLNRLVGDLLDLTRLESGALRARKEWHSLEEVVGAALTRLESQLERHPVELDLPADLPLVPLDDVLIEQALFNLIDNAIKYSPEGSAIEISAAVAGRSLAARGGGPRYRAAVRPGGADLREIPSWRAAGRASRRGPRAHHLPRHRRGARRAHRGAEPAGRRRGVQDRTAARRRTPARRTRNVGACTNIADRRPRLTPAGTGVNATPAAPPRLVLVIEDEPPIRRFLRAAFESAGFLFEEAATARDGLAQAAARAPDLIVLDLGLPDLDGIEVTQRLREWFTAPILVLSARGQERDKIRALDAGADDYVTKPFSVGELMARVRVALRHRVRGDGTAESEVVEVGPLRIDHGRRSVTLEGRPVKLTPIEFRLLIALARHPGRVLTHDHLLREVWGPAHAHQHHYLRVYMAQLRHKLEPEPSRPRLLLTEPGVGYRLREE